MAGPFSFSTACSTSAAETVNTLYATNACAVSLDSTSLTPPSGVSITGETVPAQSTPTQFDVIASPSSAARRVEDTLTPAPGGSQSLGQLTYTIFVAPGGCSGSLLFIPATAG